MIKWLFGTRNSNCDSVIQIHNQLVPLKKKDVWYVVFKWGLKSQLEFYVGPMSNLSSPFDLFFNPSRIQIRTEFMWVPVYNSTTQFLIHFSLPSRSVWSFSLWSRAIPCSYKRRQPLLPQAAPIWWLCRWVWQWVWWRFFMGLMVKSWWICKCFVGLMLKSWGFADAALI